MEHRDANGRFMPGHGVRSPGRPAMPIEVKRAQRYNEQLTDQDWDTVVTTLFDKAREGQRWAIELVLAYGMGRPKQILEMRNTTAALVVQLVNVLASIGQDADSFFQNALDTVLEVSGELGTGEDGDNGDGSNADQ